MKLFLSVYCLLAIFAQDTNLIVEGSVIPVSGIIDRLLDSLGKLLDSVIDDVGVLLDRLESTISNLVSHVSGTVFNPIDNLVSLVDGLLAKAKSSDKVVEDCAKRAIELELLKPKISNAVDKCRENLGVKIASVLADLKEEEDRGEGLISSLTKSLQNCVKGLFSASCISKAQQSSLKEIQGIVNNTEILCRRISLATDEVTKCIKDVEDNGRQLANQIYLEIEFCISEASRRN